MNKIAWLLLKHYPKLLDYCINRFSFFNKSFEFTYFSDHDHNFNDILTEKAKEVKVDFENVKIVEDTKKLWNPPYYYNQFSVDNLYFNELKDVIILIEGITICSKGISSRNFLYDSESKTINRFFILSKILNKKKTIKIKNCLLFHDRISNFNYYHWVIESLPRYVLFLNCKNINHNIPFVLLKDSPSFIEETIRLINPKQEIIWIDNDELIKADKVCSVDVAKGAGHISLNVLENLKNSFFVNCDLNDEKVDYDGIYVVRKSNGRQIVNEIELLEIFKEYKIKVVNFEGMSVKEQVQVMSKAKIFIGTHGANLTNGIFMPKNSKIIEITTIDRISEPNLRYCFYSLFSTSPFIYCPIIGQSTEDGNFNADIYINPELLIEALKI